MLNKGGKVLQNLTAKSNRQQLLTSFLFHLVSSVLGNMTKTANLFKCRDVSNQVDGQNDPGGRTGLRH